MKAGDGGLEGKEPIFPQTSSLPGAGLLTQEPQNVHFGFIQNHIISVFTPHNRFLLNTKAVA